MVPTVTILNCKNFNIACKLDLNSRMSFTILEDQSLRQSLDISFPSKAIWQSSGLF